MTQELDCVYWGQSKRSVSSSLAEARVRKHIFGTCNKVVHIHELKHCVMHIHKAMRVTNLQLQSWPLIRCDLLSAIICSRICCASSYLKQSLPVCEREQKSLV